MAGLWSMLQTAGLWGILFAILVVLVIFLGVRALNAQALDREVDEFEVRVFSGFFIRWSKSKKLRDLDEAIEPLPDQKALPPEVPPEKGGDSTTSK